MVDRDAIGVIAASCGLCSALFAGALVTYVPGHADLRRAGLVMEPGAKVKMRGVQVGRVSGVAWARAPSRFV